MIQINLLPVRKIKQRAVAKQQLVTFGFALLILLSVLAVFGLIVHSTVGGLEDDIAGLEKEEKRLEKTLAEIKELEEKRVKYGIIQKQ